MSADDATRAARRDLEYIGYPPADWVRPRTNGEGTRLLDVLVVGGGMIGQTVAFALRAEGIGQVRLIDRAPAGREGPWVTFARMPTLRSPKWVNGPDLGIPSLTYRAWFEARHGAAAWEPLGRIERADWHDYLAWVRAVVGVSIESATALVGLDARADAVHATLEREGQRELVAARHVVVALGRGPAGRQVPGFPSLAKDARVFHSSDAVDFAALAGRRVAVVGAAASAFDNAGTALEAGAAEVALFARRAELPRRNLFRALATRPWPRGYALLPDATRWDLFTHLVSERVAPPADSVRRCTAFANFTARLGEECLDVRAEPDAVVLTTARGSTRWDAVILCTGFDLSPVDRPELAGLAPRIRTWGDQVGAERARRNPTCARYPYLGAGYELVPRAGQDAAGLGRVRVFDWSAILSLGTQGGDIPGLELGAVRLAAAIVSDLFLEDAPAYEAALRAYAEDELAGVELAPPDPAMGPVVGPAAPGVRADS